MLTRPRRRYLAPLVVQLAAACSASASAAPEEARPDGTAPSPELVAFRSGALTLRGVLYEPSGPGPFPAVLYNHGRAPGMLNSKAFDILGPLFASRGWVFFAPYRRGQGHSASAGPYIGDQIDAAIRTGGVAAGSAVMVRLLETDHLSDQLAALAWLRASSSVSPDRIATAGNSFGGIEVLLGAERESYCAAIAASGGARSWATSPELRAVMTRAVRNSRAPIFLFQAENDFDLSPTRALAAAMRGAGVEFQVKIYPPFGDTPRDGHGFAWRGSSVWFEDAMRFLERHCAR